MSRYLPVLQKYLAIIPHANGPVNSKNPDKASFVFAPTQVIHENYETVRLDHRFSANDSLFATYNYDDTPRTEPRVAAGRFSNRWRRGPGSFSLRSK